MCLGTLRKELGNEDVEIDITRLTSIEIYESSKQGWQGKKQRKDDLRKDEKVKKLVTRRGGGCKQSSKFSILPWFYGVIECRNKRNMYLQNPCRQKIWREK